MAFKNIIIWPDSRNRTVSL